MAAHSAFEISSAPFPAMFLKPLLAELLAKRTHSYFSSHLQKFACGLRFGFKFGQSQSHVMKSSIITITFLSISFLFLHGQTMGQNAIEGCFYPLESYSLYEIPDAPGICFEDTLVYEGYADTLSWEDLTPEEQTIGITLEHSYMADLIITLTCPTGQELLLHNQGGAGCLLGIPIDNDSEADVPGIGYTYTWSPSALNGTWAGNSGNPTLPAGEYEAVGEWSSLDGCPVNGNWSLTICDVWSLDNGFVFEWIGPLNVIEDFELCSGEFSAFAEPSSTYCTNDGAISCVVDSVPESEITAELTYGAVVVETIEVTENFSFSDLENGLYNLSFIEEGTVLSNFQVIVEASVSPYQNKNADPICSASLDEESGFNAVIWEKENIEFIASYDVYRESNVTSQFEWIGNVLVDSLSMFIDNEFDAGTSSTRYNLIALDSCGTSIDDYGVHRTMHLQSNLGVNGEVNLFWNAYEGVGYSNFSINRSTDGINYFEIGTVANNVYAFTDQFAPSGDKWYQIRIPLNDECTPLRNRTSEFIGSNINDLTTNNIHELNANNFQLVRSGSGWELTWNSAFKGCIQAYDNAGRMVLQTSVNTGQSSIVLDFDLAGAFILEVVDNSGRVFVDRLMNW